MRSRSGWRRGVLSALALAALALTPVAARADGLGEVLLSTGGDVEVEVLNASAGYTSELWLYSPVTRFIATNREIGKKVSLGSFPVGVELKFGIYVQNTGQRYYMGPGSRNPDGIPHANVINKGAGVEQVGFEDLFGGGDRDYDDNLFLFRGGIISEPPPPANRPPVANAGPDQVKEATGAQTSVTLNGSGSSDPDGDSLSYSWKEGASQFSTQPSPTVALALGTHTLTLTVSDGKGGTASDSVSVKIQDTTAPSITVPANITVEATGPSGAAVSFNYSASDIVDNNPVVTASPSSGSTFALGTTTVTVSATDFSGNAASKSFQVTVQDTTAPDLTVPADITVEATSPAGAQVSFSPSATDIVDTNPVVTSSPASDSTFPLGTTTVNVTAKDFSGNTTTKSFQVKVQDTTAPTIKSVSVDKGQLWPPNHRMETITLSAVLSDIADTAPTWRIISVASSEPDEGLGDGDTAGDCVITGPHTVSLRAERAGGGSGRTYTITIEARDASGNTSTATVTVSVPKSQKK